MRRKRRLTLPALLLAAGALVAGLLGLPIDEGLLAGRQAHAIIGRPLTPLSYAGVARRTARRTAVYGGGYYAPPPYVPPAPYW